MREPGQTSLPGDAKEPFEQPTRGRMIEQDMTDEGYDFNGWILEFYQEQCNGIVQIDNRGFYSPKGELIVDMSVAVEDSPHNP